MSSFQFEVDGDMFRTFSRELKKVEPELAKSLNKELKRVVTETIMPAARSNAGWSSRVPAAIKPQATTKGMGLRVARGKAPHGRPFEGIGGNGTFRHPVFGNKQVWVAQTTRPFLQPAFDANREKAVEGAQKAMMEAAKSAGFR
jgi:hypothetical protein